MKATIDAKGTLVVKAETPLEAYAMHHWQENFQAGDNSSLLLTIACPDDEVPPSTMNVRGGA